LSSKSQDRGAKGVAWACKLHDADCKAAKRTLRAAPPARACAAQNADNAPP